MKTLLLEKLKKGIHVTLYLNPLEEASKMQHKGLSKDLELEENGITVLYARENHLKFVMMDHDLLWYGGINLLSGKKSQDSIVRVYSESRRMILQGFCLRRRQSRIRIYGEIRVEDAAIEARWDVIICINYILL